MGQSVPAEVLTLPLCQHSRMRNPFVPTPGVPEAGVLISVGYTVAAAVEVHTFYRIL